MRTQEVPGVPDVLLSLLKGYLFSNGIGLVSHRVLCYQVDIYCRSWVLVGFLRGLWNAALGGILKGLMIHSSTFLMIFN